MKKYFAQFLTAICVILWLGTSFGPAAVFAHDGDMHDLGTLGGKNSNAFGMNDLGQVVGESETRRGGASEIHAFLWTPSGRDGVKGNPRMKDLGTLGGVESRGTDINNFGQTVGFSTTEDGEVHAVLWNFYGASLTDLGTLGGSWSEAGAINDAGQVVGVSETETGSLHAFLWTPKFFGASQGTMVDLGSLDGLDSYGASINNAGQVAGILAAPVENPGEEPSGFRAFLWSPTEPHGSEGTMIDLGDLGGSNAIASGINRYGQIAGASETPEGFIHAFLWMPDQIRGMEGTMQDLGTLGGPDSFGYAINDQGQVAGDGSIASDPEIFHAWLWTRDGRGGVPGNRPMRDLGTLGGANSITHAINNWGMVCGASEIRNGAFHAYLWVP